MIKIMVKMMDDNVYEEDEDDSAPGRDQEGIHQLRHLLEQPLSCGKWFLWFPNGGDDVTDDDGDVGSGDDLEDLGDNDQTNLTVVRRVLAALEQPLEPLQMLLCFVRRKKQFTNLRCRSFSEAIFFSLFFDTSSFSDSFL